LVFTNLSKAYASPSLFPLLRSTTIAAIDNGNLEGSANWHRLLGILVVDIVVAAVRCRRVRLATLFVIAFVTCILN
jgi:hypothetical protein